MLYLQFSFRIQVFTSKLESIQIELSACFNKLNFRFIYRANPLKFVENK